MNSAQQNTSSLIHNEDLLEAKLHSFAKNLQDLGLNDQQVETLVMSVATTSTKQTSAKVNALMDKEDLEKWNDFVDSGPNTAQQLIVLNRFLIEKTKKDLETINSEIIDALIQDTLDEIANLKDLKIKLSQLSDEEVDKAKELLDAGDYEAVDRIINNKE